MDILSWGANNHNTWQGQLVIRAMAFLTQLFTPKVILINSHNCERVMTELYRREKPDAIAVLGGLQEPRLGLGRNLQAEILIGGNSAEQEYLVGRIENLGHANILRLELSRSTLDEAKQIIDYAKAKTRSETDMVPKRRVVGILTQEIFACRAAATVIKQAIMFYPGLVIVPMPVLDARREKMTPAYRRLAALVEAWKLWRYQRKGDVAKLDELIEYVRHHQEIRRAIS